MLVEPPNGRYYGFPKRLEEGVSLIDMLIELGYPEDEIEDAMSHMRYIPEVDDMINL